MWGCLDAGFTDVANKPLQRDLCREILKRHGHTLLLEKPPRSESLPTTWSPGAAVAAAAATPTASGGVPSGGAASGGVTGGRAANGGVTGGGWQVGV